MKFAHIRRTAAALLGTSLAFAAMSGSAQASGGMSGAASWYAHGRKTANGERFNPNAMTAAHRSLPFGTHVRVTNRANGRSIVVRINDRGPFAHGRIIDLARAPARALGIGGVSHVALAVLD